MLARWAPWSQAGVGRIVVVCDGVAPIARPAAIQVELLGG